MHLAPSAPDKWLWDLTRASLLSKCRLFKEKWLNIYSAALFKVMMNHFCIKDQKFSITGKTILHSASHYLSTNLPFGSQAFRNLDFISLLGRRITVQPQTRSWHLPLDYSLVLSAITVEWVNNEKQLTLLFISSSIVLLVIWLTSPFTRMRHSFFICLSLLLSVESISQQAEAIWSMPISPNFHRRKSLKLSPTNYNFINCANESSYTLFSLQQN